MRLGIRVLPFLLLSLGTSSCDSNIRTVHLDNRNSESLPYVANEFYLVAPFYSKHIGTNAVLIDIDHDGDDELIHARERYTSFIDYKNNAISTFYDRPHPVEFIIPGNTPTLSLVDADGDGRQNLAIIHRSEDHRYWLIEVLDPFDNSFHKEYRLSAISDRQADGLWHGQYTVHGAINVPTPAGERRALVLCCNVGYDIDGRGIIALDFETGEVLWHRQTGASPRPKATYVTDLDGDGDLEIVVGCHGANNLKGEIVEGFSDNHSYLFVLNESGEIEWTQQILGFHTNIFIAVDDLDSDGKLEIISSVNQQPDVRSRLSVWSNNGELLDDIVTDAIKFRFVFTSRHTQTGEPQVIVEVEEGYCYQYVWKPSGGLDLKAQVTTEYSPALSGFLELIEENPGPELILSSTDGRVFILDSNLNPLASVFNPEGNVGRFALAWKADSTTTIQLRANERMSGATYSKRRIDVQRLKNWTLAILTIGLPLAAFAGYRWRRSTATSQRQARLQLLSELELSGHGAVSVLKSLRRLIWFLDSIQSDVSLQESTRERISALRWDLLENGLPNLDQILDLSVEAGMERRRVHRSRQETRELTERITALQADKPNSTEETETLKTLSSSLEETLQLFRSVAESHFHCELKSVTARVIESHSESILAGKVRVIVDEDNASLRADSEDLAFILENLVGNALRAMETSDDRVLSIDWIEHNGWLEIRVSDSGPGVPEDLREKIFDPGFSSKAEGGGLGLAKSRQILRRYGGILKLTQLKQSDSGSCFVLTLPAIADGNGN